MVLIYFIPIFLFLLSLEAEDSMNVKPILNSDNEKAVPVQNFDFVYIPKDVVMQHLPAFDPKQLNIKAHKIAQKYNMPAPAFNETAAQIDLIEWYKRKRMSETDPSGEKRRALKAEKCEKTKKLEAIISIRKNLIADIQRINRKIHNDCKTSGRLSDFQYSECAALRSTSKIQSQELMQINEKERQILHKLRDIKKTISLL